VREAEAAKAATVAGEAEEAEETEETGLALACLFFSLANMPLKN
jgi:hypothetical protein